MLAQHFQTKQNSSIGWTWNPDCRFAIFGFENMTAKHNSKGTLLFPCSQINTINFFPLRISYSPESLKS